MLSSFSIRNFGLIQDQQLDFDQGFNVISGETGSGKSMILSALSVTFGGRWNPKLFYDTDKKCILEAQFKLKNNRLKPLFDEHDLDFDQELSVRREFLPSGKTRQFINDTPVKSVFLKTIGSQLIAIHSQHQNLDLGETENQIEFLDQFVSEHQPKFAQLKLDYEQGFESYRTQQNELKQLEELRQKQALEKDFQSFILDELQQANLDDLNEDDIQNRIKQAENQEQIQSALSDFHHTIESETGPVEVFKRWSGQFSALQKVSPKFSDWAKRFDVLIMELNDLNYDVSTYETADEYSPDDLDKMHSTLFSLDQLKQKHQVATLPELIDIRTSIENKDQENEELNEKISNLKQDIEDQKVKLSSLAKKLSDFRQKEAPKLKTQMEVLLKDLAMPTAQIVFHFEHKEDLQSSGTDEIDLLFSANKGFEAKSLKQLASGGEFARLSLVLHSVQNKHAELSLVLDEIDTGVSGEVAHKMGELMKTMSKDNTILCISHLAQVVSKAQTHFKVAKNHQDEKTRVAIHCLNSEERINEVASLLSGEQITEEAILAAKRMMNEPV